MHQQGAAERGRAVLVVGSETDLEKREQALFAHLALKGRIDIFSRGAYCFVLKM